MRNDKVATAAEKKQIILDVKYRIQRGEPKQQILEDLSPLYKDKVTLVKQIEMTPSKAMKEKHRLLNYLLAFLLLTALVVDIAIFKDLDSAHWFTPTLGYLLVNWLTALGIILDTVFLIGVLMCRIEIYSWIAVRGLLTLITIVGSYGYFDIGDKGTMFILLVVSFGLILISFFMGLMLCVKLCPPRIPKIIEVDIDGTEKIKKTIYVFPD